MCCRYASGPRGPSASRTEPWPTSPNAGRPTTAPARRWAAATIGPAGLSWISAGDCRIYHWKPDGGADGWLRRLNPLHNPPGEPDRLTSYLAGSAIPETAAPHAAWEPLATGDAVIVASDGITTLTDDELATSIRAYDPTKTLSPSLAVWLVGEVLQRKRPDQGNVAIAATYIGRANGTPR